MLESKIRVNLAKYNKDGNPFRISKDTGGSGRGKNRRIGKPSFRDYRRYSDVLMGKTPNAPTSYRGGNGGSVIPFVFDVKVMENREMGMDLMQAIVVENERVLDNAHSASILTASNVPYKSMFSISPTKLLLFFSSVDDTMNAVNEGSEFWGLFDDVRLWTEGETVNERIVWLECCGLHPKYRITENITIIGKK